ncbi:MAG: helix-turn-helix transcriptional regulator [Nocardioides sp.]|uniref:helix-turn-helix domain-containing protein n=1 Tax=Nocardioides sp. TaxID=35761 RepID=UPI002382AB44|nr:helix-turn-helix transcriptional regulator [Nocardioides sp.]MDE0775550.1 helix-turn-helix transcriptional regulator [Nocardioides sp.]
MDDQKPSVEASYGQPLRQARLAAGLTQQSLAELMRASGFTSWMQTTVTKTEAGTRPLRLDEFVALNQVLGYKPADTLAALMTEEPTARDVLLDKLRKEIATAEVAVHNAELALKYRQAELEQLRNVQLRAEAP